MLKRTPITLLTTGMILGRPVYKEDMSILLAEGTQLTASLIESLDEKGIPAVHILEEDKMGVVEDEPSYFQVEDDNGEKDQYHAGFSSITEEIKVVPEKALVLDGAYVNDYMHLLLELKDIYDQAQRTGVVNVELANHFAIAIRPLCKGAIAVAHIHNMEVKGDYLYHHSMHVSILAGLMGRWLRFPLAKQRQLILAGLFMDIGNMRLSPTLLGKTGKLTLDERKLMEKHTEYGFDMIRSTSLGEEAEIAISIYQHHERNNGSGYPKGEIRENITEFARILALIDMYDAMGSNRAYAKKHSPFEVFEVMSNDIMAGKLDTDFGFQFIRRICHSLHGNWVQLSNGEKGKIVYIDESRLVSLPIVQTLSGDFIDLNRRSDIRIEHLLTKKELVA